MKIPNNLIKYVISMNPAKEKTLIPAKEKSLKLTKDRNRIQKEIFS